MANIGEILQGLTGANPQQHAKTGPSEPVHEPDRELAQRLASIIEDANGRVAPLTSMIRQTIGSFEARKNEGLDPDALVQTVRPLVAQAEKILREGDDIIHKAVPDSSLKTEAQHKASDHKASPEEQRLAEALKTLVEEVRGTTGWASDKLNSFPEAKRVLGPLLDALDQSLAEIVVIVGQLLAGVLSVVENLLKGVGLDDLLKGVMDATGLDKVYKGLGVDFLKSGKK